MMIAGKVLVTGAYGLIGHETTVLLRARGIAVVPTDILALPPADAAFEAVPLAVSGVDALTDFLTQHGIGSIVHTAGVSGPMLGRDRPHDVLATNAGGTLDLYEAARRAGIGTMVLLSSSSAYGAVAAGPVEETTRLGATDVYGVSKIAGELIATAYAAHGVGTVVLRPCWVYGPRRRTLCVIKTMVADALAGRTTHFPYGRGFPRQFVQVSDVAAAIAAALDRPDCAGAAFNIADGRRLDLDEVAALVGRVLPQARVAMDPGPDPDDVLCAELDIRAAAERLGWRPAVDLETGIARLAAELASP